MNQLDPEAPSPAPQPEAAAPGTTHHLDGTAHHLDGEVRTLDGAAPAVRRVRSAPRWLDEVDAEDLRRLVASQEVIEQAKGMLMGYYGIDGEQAFALLRRWSSWRHAKIRDLCAELVDAGARYHPSPFGAVRVFLEQRD